MTESEAIVERLDAGEAVVRVGASGGCGRCNEPGGCGIFTPSRSEVRTVSVENTLDVQPGDRVVVGIENGMVLAAALRVYVLPVLLLLLGAFVGARVATPVDLGAALGGAMGLGAGLGFVRLCRNAFVDTRKCRLVMVRRVLF